MACASLQLIKDTTRLQKHTEIRFNGCTAYLVEVLWIGSRETEIFFGSQAGQVLASLYS